MGDLKADAWAETPKPREWWRKLTNEDRIFYVDADSYKLLLKITGATVDGQVLVELTDTFPASQRGPLLLDYEAYLKRYVDPALTVWLEPMGDRNALRNLRGVEMK